MTSDTKVWGSLKNELNKSSWRQKSDNSVIVVDKPVRIKQEALDEDERRQEPDEGQNEGSGDASE